MIKALKRLPAIAGMATALTICAIASATAAPRIASMSMLNVMPVVQAGLFSGKRHRTPQQELQRILKTHYYYGRNVGRSVREAAGPGTTLLRDERVWGQPAKCSFVSYRGGKAIVCDRL